ncbi:MAG: hypothetical protein JNJ86_14895 [Chitinophagaceae bacterium]|nr:hypothetical protein [Chitinophagaceae bacterium]
MTIHSVLQFTRTWIPLLIVLLFGSINSVYAQNNLPEFNDKPAYYDAGTRQLKELEKSQYNKIAKAKGLFKAEAGYFINGTSSPVKIAKKEELQFVVKVAAGADPSSVLDLGRFEVRKDQRVFIIATAKTGSSSTSFEKINFEVKKIKEGYYYLVVKNLEKGEYFFGSAEFMFAFSVE